MTLPPGDANRPTSFDFGLSGPAAPGTSEEPLTRRSARRAAVDSRSLAVPLVITLVIVAVLGGAGFGGWYLVKTSEDEVKADSAAFCSLLAENPDALSQPGFGWPTDGADLTTTLGLMKDYRKHWRAIAKAAPPTIQPDAEAVASAASIVVTGIVDSKTLDRAATLATMDAVTSKTAIRAWSAKYCD